MALRKDSIDTLFGIASMESQLKQAKGIANEFVDYMDKSAKKVNSIQIELGVKQSMSSLKKLASEFDGVTEKQAKKITELAKAYSVLALAKQREASASKTQTQEAISLRKEKERLAKIEEKKAASLKKENNAYEKAKIAYRNAANEAKRLWFEKKKDSEETKRAIALARQYHSELLQAEGAVGQMQRQVGHYNVVGREFNQLLREVPNAGLSFRTFLISISNNATYFFEAVSKAIKSGESFKSILLSMGKSLVGVVGVINLAVLALTYFASNMGKGKDETDDATTSVEEYTKALNEMLNVMSKNIDEEINKASILLKIAGNRNLSDEQRIKAVEKLQNMYPSYLKQYTAEEILAGKAADAIGKINQAIRDREAAQFYTNKAALENERLYKQETGLIAKRNELQEKFNNTLKEYNALKEIPQDELTDSELFEASGKRLLLFGDDGKSGLKKDLEDLNKQINIVKNSEKAALEQAAKYAGLAGDMYLGQVDPLKEQEDLLKKLEREERKRLKILHEMRKAEQSLGNIPLLSSTSRNRAGNLQAQLKNQLALIDSIEKERLIRLNNQYKNGKITAEEYQKELTAITEQYERDRLEIEIEGAQKLLDSTGVVGEERLNLEQQLQDARLELAKLGNDQLLDEERRTKAEEERLERELARKKEEIRRKVVQVAQQAAALVINIDKNASQETLNSLDKEEEALSRDEERKRARIERTIEDSKQKEDAITAMEASTDAERQLIENRRREEQKRQAQRDKELAIFNILTNMYLGVAKELGTGGVKGIITGSAIIAFAGGLIAAMQALTVPAYAEGTDDHGGGLALVGEGRKGSGFAPELILEPNKAPYMVSKPTLLDLPRHTQVVPMDGLSEVNQAIAANGGMSDTYLQNMIGEIKGLRYDMKQNGSVVRTHTEDSRLKGGVTRKGVKQDFITKRVYRQ